MPTFALYPIVVAKLYTLSAPSRDIYDFLEVVGKALPLEATPVPFIAGVCNIFKCQQ